MLYSAICVFCTMVSIFILALLKKDNSIVDIAWGIGFILIAILTFFLEAGTEPRHILVTALIFLWVIENLDFYDMFGPFQEVFILHKSSGKLKSQWQALLSNT